MNFPTQPSITTTIRPMLAQDVEPNQLTGRVIVQPKLDGVRAFWDAHTQSLHTRNGRIITSCGHLVRDIYALGLQHLCLDAEIYCRALPFETINGLVRKREPEDDTLTLELHVFDIINDDETAEQRAQRVNALPVSRLIRPMATFFADATEVEDYYEYFLDSDCEGIIVRAPYARYIQGRSKALGRIKPVYDLEATLIGFEPSRSERHRDTFGALILQLPNGKTFKCSGLTDQQRREFWRQKPLGVSITVLFKSLTQNGLPREPRFKTIRTDLIGVAA